MVFSPPPPPSIGKGRGERGWRETEREKKEKSDVERSFVSCFGKFLTRLLFPLFVNERKKQQQHTHIHTQKEEEREKAIGERTRLLLVDEPGEGDRVTLEKKLRKQTHFYGSYFLFLWEPEIVRKLRGRIDKGKRKTSGRAAATSKVCLSVSWRPALFLPGRLFFFCDPKKPKKKKALFFIFFFSTYLPPLSQRARRHATKGR